MAAAGEGRLPLLVLPESIAVARDETGLGAMPGLAAGLVRLGAGICSMPNKINQQVACQWYVQLPAVIHTCYARARCITVHTWLVRFDIEYCWLL